jgi:hypothetical protein
LPGTLPSEPIGALPFVLPHTNAGVMPVKADQGSQLNQSQEIGGEDTQRTVDA